MAPEPFTTRDMDVRNLDGFMLNFEKLFSSELWALTKNSGNALRGALALWCKSWKQLPPASLPDDERILAAFADMPLARFRRLRPLVMHGFTLCSDGRFYHRVVADQVLKVWPSVLKKRQEREADNERLKRWREARKAKRETVNETRFETVNETPMKRHLVLSDTDTDTDTENRTKRSILAKPANTAPPKWRRSDTQKNLLNGHQQDWEEFWRVYPRRVAKAQALKAYAQAIDKTSPATLLEAAKCYARSRAKEPPEYTKHPATWLNAECWLDEGANVRPEIDPVVAKLRALEGQK
jgi:hypothetical protein